jgi:hypothetical protein
MTDGESFLNRTFFDFGVLANAATSRDHDEFNRNDAILESSRTHNPLLSEMTRSELSPKPFSWTTKP